MSLVLSMNLEFVGEGSFQEYILLKYAQAQHILIMNHCDICLPQCHLSDGLKEIFFAPSKNFRISHNPAICEF